MKEKIKTGLYKLLGQKKFIQLLYSGYKFAYNLGFLKSDPIYKYHYFSKALIHEGNTVLDIGANLGYYTYLFQKWVGATGNVISVEPVPQFMSMLKKNHDHHNNVTLLNYALGTEEKDVELVVQGEQQYLRTGLAHIKESEEDDRAHFKFSAKMKRASELFKDVARIDFLKIDIEGYETVVLPEMKSILEKHKPIIQAETYGEQRVRIDALLHALGYEPFELENGKLIPSRDTLDTTYGDVIYFTNEHKAKYLV